jgi:hypothetical protein
MEVLEALTVDGDLKLKKRKENRKSSELRDGGKQKVKRKSGIILNNEVANKSHTTMSSKVTESTSLPNIIPSGRFGNTVKAFKPIRHKQPDSAGL